MSLNIRPATQSDIRTLYELSYALAVYEKKEPHEIFVTEEKVARWAFGPNRCFEALIATESEEAVGMATYYVAYSGFMGAPYLFVEDLFVTPPNRHRGIGTKMLQMLARTAIERECCRMQLTVFDWNENSIKFYESVGMVVRKDLYQCRLEIGNLDKLLHE